MTQQQYFPALTGLRAIAAYMVFVYHYNPFHIARFPALHHFTDQLHTGVSLFFVLSGFLLFHRYGSEEKIAIRPYFQNRFAKIYPVFFLLTTVAWMLRDFQQVHHYIANITLLKGLFDKLKFTLIQQTWSLTTEEFFYLFLPLIILAPTRARFLILFPCFLGVGFLLVFLFEGNSFYGFFNSIKFMLTYTFFGRCAEFFAGIALAQLMLSRGPTNSNGKLTWLGIIAFVGVLAIMAFASALVGVDGSRIGVILVNNFILPGAAVLLLYGLATETTFVSRILSTRAFQLLGKSSYVFYLNPLLLVPHVLQVPMIMSPLATVWVFIVMIILSIVVYLAVEKPLHKLLSAKSPASPKN